MFWMSFCTNFPKRSSSSRFRERRRRGREHVKKSRAQSFNRWVFLRSVYLRRFFWHRHRALMFFRALSLKIYEGTYSTLSFWTVAERDIRCLKRALETKPREIWPIEEWNFGRLRDQPMLQVQIINHVITFLYIYIYTSTLANDLRRIGGGCRFF